MIPRHYYTPVIIDSDIDVEAIKKRLLPGLDINEGGQLSLLSHFCFREELLNIPNRTDFSEKYRYENPSFKSGDSEFLYNFVRHFKPKRIVEVGSGQSSVIIELALAENRRDNTAYECEHICIEPYEQPWLENLGVEVIRKRVQDCDAGIFSKLGQDDMLFIDSSHMIRPQGDVVYLYLHVLASIADGVLIHAHDIFTPNDYLREWLIDERRLWNEQYLLEALLTHTSRFEVLAAVNWLLHSHPDKLAEAAPVLLREVGREPGSFWFRSRMRAS